MQNKAASNPAGATEAPLGAHAAALPDVVPPEARFRSALGLAAVAVFVSAVFGLLFFRETALSYSIGYNLYGATRVLNGEVPYRDFHTLYPPATVYLNALLFNAFGISLYTALLGVCVFKVLTSITIYLCAKRLMTLSWALAATGFSVIWLRPNGPFKAVPMHYGGLFLALSLLFVLRYIDGRRVANLFAAGVSIGVLALFKHNIGAYALIGFSLFLVFRGNPLGLRFERLAILVRSAGMMLLGVVLPIFPVLAYMHYQGALKAMGRTLLFGPGEFLFSRLAATPSPLAPALMALILGGVAVVVYWLHLKPAVKTILAGLALISILSFVILAPEGAANQIVFYAPVIAIVSAGVACRLLEARDENAGRQLCAVSIVAAAAFMESFPRFAREQSIASMPFIGLLTVFILFTFREPILNRTGAKLAGQIAIAALPVAIFLLGARFFAQTFFDKGLHMRSNTGLSSTRGRGVYFPSEAASEIDGVVAFVQQQVAEGGYIFAQSYAGSSYLFLADRRNPSGAQFWGGVGVTKAEREQTLRSIQEKDVRLVITSDRDMAGERYKPMSEFLQNQFKPTARFGEVLILERVLKGGQLDTPISN
ncbi:MAG TPA: glycosyltransferase family 39 protein [Blastocatellia bacterium]|nr:glycosyltransferase family 39 protein [Blastocatellia bacterium]